MAQRTSATESRPEAGSRTPYRITVHNIEACNCRHGCNCQFGGFPDNGSCEALIGGQVEEGSFGDVPLAGIRFVIAAMYPKAIHEGDGRVAVFIDDRATPAQADAMAAILSGQAGGMPFEALAGTIASLDGPVRAPIEMTVNGTRSSYRIPGVLELSQTPIKDAVSGQDKEVQIVYPKGGFFWDVGNITNTARMYCRHGGINFEHPGGFSSYSKPTWTNQAQH